MIFKKYINFENEKGELVEDILIPMDIPKNTIHEISPMFNDYGALYKNVTLITDMYGKQYRVRGNWKEWVDIIRNEKENKIGYL